MVYVGRYHHLCVLTYDLVPMCTRTIRRCLKTGTVCRPGRIRTFLYESDRSVLTRAVQYIRDPEGLDSGHVTVLPGEGLAGQQRVLDTLQITGRMLDRTGHIRICLNIWTMSNKRCTTVWRFRATSDDHWVVRH